MTAEALVDVALATTIATVDADNSRQQTTISNRLGAKPCVALAATEVASEAAVGPAVAAALWRWWGQQRQRRRQQ